jgi:hypothetical protein
LAVKEWYRIHRQDAKDAKNFAKQNSFPESKTLQISSLERHSRNQNWIPRNCRDGPPGRLYGAPPCLKILAGKARSCRIAGRPFLLLRSVHGGYDAIIV